MPKCIHAHDFFVLETPKTGDFMHFNFKNVVFMRVVCLDKSVLEIHKDVKHF